jgi:hypothetical protein
MIFLFISILPFSAAPGGNLSDYITSTNKLLLFLCAWSATFLTLSATILSWGRFQVNALASKTLRVSKLSLTWRLRWTTCISQKQHATAHSWCNIWKGAQRRPTLKSAWDAADEFPAQEGSRGASYISIFNVTFRNSPSSATQHKAPAFNDARESQPFPGCHGAPTTVFAGTHVICTV